VGSGAGRSYLDLLTQRIIKPVFDYPFIYRALITKVMDENQLVYLRDWLNIGQSFDELEVLIDYQLNSENYEELASDKVRFTRVGGIDSDLTLAGNISIQTAHGPYIIDWSNQSWTLEKIEAAKKLIKDNPDKTFFEQTWLNMSELDLETTDNENYGINYTVPRLVEERKERKRELIRWTAINIQACGCCTLRNQCRAINGFPFVQDSKHPALFNPPACQSLLQQ
jgi:hypothetical protein